ncbi:MAG: hypothetical protein ABJF88_08405 [Rhodothermales bacterium]
MTEPTRLPLRWAWRGALAVFVLAGLTGAFFRFAIAHGGALGLDLGNVRHAHSHLMYFGWATPALFALIAYRLPHLGGRPMPGAGLVIGATFVLALLAYPPFLLFGYAPAVIGDARLPLSVVAAGLNVLAWYAFAALYARARRAAPSSLGLWLFDLALFFLVLATLGAWGLPALQVVGSENIALKTALTHLFLDVFSEGWFVFGVLGLAATEAESESRLARWGMGLAAAGVPFTFALGMPAALVPPLFAGLARLGGVLVGVGLLVVVVALWPRLRGLWRLALGLLALKALGEVAVSAAPGAGWAAVPGFRILYLHLMLLGFVTLGLVAAARGAWGTEATRGHTLFAASVVLLLASLLTMTPAWPAAWGGAWIAEFVAWCALGPVLAAGAMGIGFREIHLDLFPPKSVLQ